MIIGGIGDQHHPFCHPGYMDFCSDTFEKHGVDKIVNIGDVVDGHALSFHDHDPNGRSAEDESELAMKEVQRWYRAFPSMRVCIGNHDARYFRTAQKAGIPNRYIKSYREVWNTPKWLWALEHTIDGVLYEHGTGSSGKDAAYNRARDQRCSVAMGHVHSFGGVKFHMNPFNRIFGLNVGCGIDIGAYAFEYGKMFTTRPTLGCGVVFDGQVGLFVPMPCGRGERYHRSRFTKRKSA